MIYKGYHSFTLACFRFCKATNSCVPITSSCNGLCYDPNPWESNCRSVSGGGSLVIDPDKRFFCEEEGLCKKTFETCEGKCVRPCRGDTKPYYCKSKGQCVDYITDCDDGCPDDQLYCKETDSCHTLSQPCYGECRVRFKEVRAVIQHAYCEATNSCTPYFTPCNGTCRPYITATKTQDGYPSQEKETVPCPGLDLCYVEPSDLTDYYLRRPVCKATQVCQRHSLQCGDDEYVCEDQCVPLAATCNNRTSSSNCLIAQYVKKGNRCVRKEAGVFHNYRWCPDTQTCIAPQQPCGGRCKRNKPRLALCEAEGKCINIKNTCAGKCLSGRVKCPTEDRCVHKNGLHLCANT